MKTSMFGNARHVALGSVLLTLAAANGLATTMEVVRLSDTMIIVQEGRSRTFALNSARGIGSSTQTPPSRGCENPVEPPPDPGAWFHLRIVVAHPVVKVFVNNEADPCLVVTQLSDRKSGWLGLWVGNGSGGEFASLGITPTGKE